MCPDPKRFPVSEIAWPVKRYQLKENPCATAGTLGGIAMPSPHLQYIIPLSASFPGDGNVFPSFPAGNEVKYKVSYKDV